MRSILIHFFALLLTLGGSSAGFAFTGTLANEPHYYLYDGHGSVRQLVQEYQLVPTGPVFLERTDTYDYDAFGLLIASTSSTPLSPTDNVYLYAGEQYDFDLGLSHRSDFFAGADGQVVSGADDGGVAVARAGEAGQVHQVIA